MIDPAFQLTQRKGARPSNNVWSILLSMNAGSTLNEENVLSALVNQLSSLSINLCSFDALQRWFFNSIDSDVEASSCALQVKTYIYSIETSCDSFVENMLNYVTSDFLIGSILTYFFLFIGFIFKGLHFCEVIFYFGALVRQALGERSYLETVKFELVHFRGRDFLALAISGFNPREFCPVICFNPPRPCRVFTDISGTWSAGGRRSFTTFFDCGLGSVKTTACP